MSGKTTARQNKEYNSIQHLHNSSITFISSFQMSEDDAIILYFPNPETMSEVFVRLVTKFGNIWLEMMH